MEKAGIERRIPNRSRPVSSAGLARAFTSLGATIAGLARFGVSDATVARWLAEAGLISPDPGIDHWRLEIRFAADAR